MQQSHTGSSDNPFTFVGRQGYYHDEELSLYLAGSRYYDPAAGRRLSEDPIRLAGGDPNLYRYVRNNPVNATDPSGLKDGSGWKGPADLLDTLSIPITFGTTRSFVAGVAEGFVVEGLVETAKGVKAVVVGIGKYLYFAGSYWKGGLDSAAQTSAGQSIDAATTATLKYGPMVATIAGDLPILAGARSGELSPETVQALQTASEVLPEIISAITEEMATMPDERKAKLAGTLLGVVLFEVALAAATAGAAVALSGAAKAGKLAGMTQKLNKIASPALVRKLEKLLDSVLDKLHKPKGQQTQPAKSKSAEAPPPAAAKVDTPAPAPQPARPTAEVASATGKADIPNSPASVHTGRAAAESSLASRASVLRALRAADTPEAHAVAKLIKRNKIILEILDTDPFLQGAAGRKPWGSNVIQVYRDRSATARRAAGVIAHETKHWLQKITPLTYRRIHEFEAYQFQRRAGFLSMTDEEIWNLINTSPLYRDVAR